MANTDNLPRRRDFGEYGWGLGPTNIVAESRFGTKLPLHSPVLSLALQSIIGPKFCFALFATLTIFRKSAASSTPFRNPNSFLLHHSSSP